MASLFKNKVDQFETPTGTVATGYYLHFLVVGTTTPKDTYPTEADAIAATNANSNPIALNSAGRSANDVWIVGRYRLIFSTSATIGAGTQIDVPIIEESVPASDFQDGSPTFGGNNSGSANALAFSFSPTLAAYTNGAPLRGRITADNTTAVTVNCNGLGAKSLVRRDGTALVSGDLQGPAIIEFVFDSASDVMRLLSCEITYGRLTAVRTYTSNDTWTKPVGLDFIIVEGVGPGGGGGGADVDAGPCSGCGGGGGGGGYARKKIAAATLGATEAVTVGGAGAGGTAGNNAGSNGAANTSFGAHITCNLGTGGSSVAAGNTVVGVAGGAGGTATGGDINIAGQTGHAGWRNGNTYQIGGAGGSSQLGQGGAGVAVTTQAGKAASGYGAGGGGACADDAGTDQAGGTGTAGLVVVYEYSL
jgi:hypothetical protein